MNKRILDSWDALIKILAIILIIVFVLFPFVSVFKIAFIQEGKFSLESFSFLKNESYLLRNSVVAGLCSATTSTILAVSVALMRYFATPRQKKFIVFVLLLTMISPPFIGSLTYIQLFGRNGFITKDILNLSMNPYGLLGIVAVQTLSYTSLNGILLNGYLDQFDQTMIESAKSLKADTTSIVLDIILPLLKPAIAVAFLLSFMRSLADFGTPMIIGGSYNTLATEAYLSVIARGNTTRASAISILLFLPSVIVFYFYQYFSKRSESASKSSRVAEANLKKNGIFYLLFFLAAFFILWTLIQYTVIFMTTVTRRSKGELIFTLKNIKKAIPYLKDSFVRSVIYSLIAGFFASFIGLIISYYHYIRGSKVMKMVDFIANTPYIVPGTFFGLGYIFAFNKKPLLLTGTASIVILNLIFRQVPMSIRTITNSMTLVEEETMSSAKDVGAHHLFILKDIILPGINQGIYLSFINAFISTMTTIGSVIFLIYPSRKLATMVLFELVSGGKNDIAAVLSVTIILICLIASLISYKYFNRGGLNDFRS